MTLIIADTTCGLSVEEANRLKIPLIPQQVIFGEETFQDGTQLSIEKFLQKLKESSKLPKTAAPLASHYIPLFEDAANKGETVIVIAPSGKISGTTRSAEMAKNEFPQADIRIIDTLTIAGCLGSMVLTAHDLAQKGVSPNEIEALINKMKAQSRTYFVVDTLEYLQKGGRIGTAKALLGELLKVKPILQIKDGQAAAFEQERTKKKAVARLIEITCEKLSQKNDINLCVMHIDAKDEAEALRDELSSRLNVPKIPLYLLPPAIIVHAGPKTLAVGFFE